MNRQLYLSVVTVFVMFYGGSQSKVEAPDSSALGDSPTITGNISNLSEANLEGTTLTVKAELNPAPGTGVIAEGNVAANGDFSIKLPGMATFEGDLQESVFENTCPYGTLTVTPETSKTVDLQLFLYSNDQRIAQLYYVGETVDGELIEASYTFSDRDVLNKGTCAWENFDVDMKKGWNTLIIGRFPDGETSGVRTAVPDSSFKWQIP